MKKYALMLLLALIFLPQKAFAENNFIYSIEVSKDKEAPAYELVLKSDYKAKIKSKTDGSNSIYFDIKNTSLKEGFSTMYDNANGIESVIAQQIGNKVRIYIKGTNTGNTKISFNTVEKQKLSDSSANYALAALILLAGFGYVMFEKRNKKTKKTSKYACIRQEPVHYALKLNNELLNKSPAKRHLASSEIVKGAGTIAQRYCKANANNGVRAEFRNNLSINRNLLKSS